MSNATVASSGLLFVWEQFRAYIGSWWLPAILVIGLLYTLIKERKKNQMMFAVLFLLLLVTIYNPLIVNKVVSKMKLDSEYYRFFWIFPIVSIAAYYLTKIVFLGKKRIIQILTALILAGCIMRIGTPMEGVVNNFRKIENVYKVPSILGTITEVIHNDSDKEMPHVVFPEDLNFSVRQYDPSIYLVIRRNSFLVFLGSNTVGVKQSSKRFKRELLFMNLMKTTEEISEARLQKYIKKCSVDYIVMPYGREDRDALLEAAGCERINELGGYVLWRCHYE